MTRRARIAIFAPAVVGFAALLAWSFAGLPHFGHYRGPYGFVLNRIVVPDRHTSNVVQATTFDVRGLDTMGEEFILFAAVVGIVMLLRQGGSRPEPDPQPRSDAVRFGGVLAVGACVLVGLWLVAFGYVTPGGGFQGGVVVAAGALLLYLASNFRCYRPFANEEGLDPLEGLGVAGFVIVGLAALASGEPFLQNLFGPGRTGTLLSGGSIPIVNWAAAIEVTAAMLVLFAEFLQEQE